MRVIGRVVDPAGRQPGELILIDGGRDGRRIACDSLGRFQIEVEGKRMMKLAIERDGIVVSQVDLDPATISGELLLEVPPRPLVLEDPVSVAVAANRPRSLREGVLDRLRDWAPRLSIEENAVAGIERSLDELQELSDLAFPAIAGDAGALRRLQAGLEREIPFDFNFDLGRFKPGPETFGIDPCAVVPRSPWTMVMAGMLLDGGNGTAWTGRAVAAILRRAEPAARVARALSGLDAGMVGEDRLREAVTFAQQVESAEMSGLPVWEVLRDRSSGLGARSHFDRGLRPFDQPAGGRLRGGFGGGSGGDLGGVRPGGLGTYLDPCNLEWLECAHTFVTTPPPRTPDPPAVGRVEPTDIEAGSATQIRLFPPPGGSFGSSQHSGWVIELGKLVLAPTSWTANEIVLDIPAMPPKCYALRWSVDQSQGAEFFNQQSAACARFFGERPLIKPFIQIPIANVSAVGRPSVTYFTADKVAGKLNAEGCTPVEIAWKVDRLVCTNSKATFALQVTDDTGAILYQGTATDAAVSVTGREDRTYTLRANNELRGMLMPAAIATVQVERYQRLIAVRKISPAGLVRTGSAVTIEVEISCPADDPAQVVLTSDQPTRCPGLTITVPIGQAKATGQVNAGGATGRVRLSGGVTGVNQAPVSEVFVVHNPVFDAIVSANLEQCDGGAVTLRVRGATSVNAVGLSGPGGFVASSGPLQVMASVPNDPASGTLQVTARFGPLASGTYAAQAQADGVMLAGGQVVCSLGNPSVSTPSANPGVVQVCQQTSVTISATSRRATELSITRSDGTVVGMPVQGTNPCGTLSATAVVQVTGTATFKAVAKRPGAPTATADVTVGEASALPQTTSRASLQNIMDRVSRTLADGSIVQEEVTLFVYVVSVKPNQTATTSRLGAITSPSGTISYTPAQCEVFELWGLRTDNPAEMQTFNWKFRSNLILGHPSFIPITFPISGN